MSPVNISEVVLRPRVDEYYVANAAQVWCLPHVPPGSLTAASGVTIFTKRNGKRWLWKHYHVDESKALCRTTYLLETELESAVVVLHYSVFTKAFATDKVCHNSITVTTILAEVRQLPRALANIYRPTRYSALFQHANRPNHLSQEQVDMVKEHIESYPAESSHYSRHKNPNRLYLSPFLTISEMLRQYEVWSAARHVVPVSHAAYRNIFCTHFNYGFSMPRSDTCNKCERAQTDASACNIDAHKALAEAAFQQ